VFVLLFRRRKLCGGVPHTFWPVTEEEEEEDSA